jgi:hypothetical protein
MTKFGLVFLIALIRSTVMAGMPPRRSADSRSVGPGVALNERLIALAGAALFLLVAAIATTTMFLPLLLPEH